MRILIVGFYTRSYMPYIEKYESILREHKISYDIIYFDRDRNAPPNKEGNCYQFHRVMGTNKIKKILPYFRYIRYVKKIIKENPYDKIIVLTTVPAVLLSRVLLHQYPGRFIFDYRDYSYEKLGWYKKAVNRLAETSYATFISSAGFYNYVDRHPNVGLAHNISNETMMVKKTAPIFPERIHVGFVGYVRYFDVNTKLIEAFANNPSYTLYYIGTLYDDCDLPAFVAGKNIRNVVFQGYYSNDDKPAIYEGITLINSIYSLNSPEVQWAVPNRLYDAAVFKKPLLVSKGTYLAEVVLDYGLGCVIDPFHDDIAGIVNDYIQSFDPEQFDANARRFLADIAGDERAFQDKVAKFCE